MATTIREQVKEGLDTLLVIGARGFEHDDSPGRRDRVGNAVQANVQGNRRGQLFRSRRSAWGFTSSCPSFLPYSSSLR